MAASCLSYDADNPMLCRYDAGTQKPSPLQQSLSKFFGPELLQWLLVEMEQNRDKSVASSKVRIDWHQLKTTAPCDFRDLRGLLRCYSQTILHNQMCRDSRLQLSLNRKTRVFQQVYPYGKVLEEGSKQVVKGHDLRGTTTILESLRQIQ